MPHHVALTTRAYVPSMRASAIVLIVALTVAVPAVGAPSRPERTATLTFKVVTLNGERQVLSRHDIDPYSFALSPDHRQFAYVPQTCSGCRATPLLMADVRGSGERVFVDRGGIYGISWAPSGQELAVDWHGTWLVNRDGSNFRQVSRSRYLSWSPDSTSLASSRPIGVLSLETGAERSLSPGFGPAWSPDGTQIAFTKPPLIKVVSTRTGEVRELTRGADPTWSPDGRRIAFIRYVRDAYHLDLWEIASQGGKPRSLARGLARFAPILWSPKGKQIAYVRRRTLFVRKLSGRVGRNLAYEYGADVTPLAWSRDGRRILYFTLNVNS